jgi:hypothetical protein
MNETPKPKPPVNKQAAKQTTAPEEKKSYVRKPHLTHRPFSNEALFAKLREQAQPNAPKNPRRQGKKGTDK